MKTLRLATMTLSLCALCAPSAMAENAGTSSLRYPSAVRQTSLDSGMDYLAADAAPAVPANKPAAPPVPAAPAAQAATATEYVPCDESDEGFKLFRMPGLACRGIDVRGWIDQGFTYNPDRPANRFNGPVGLNDRSNEYQMNQLYLLAERKAETGGCGVDVGGRIDLLLGTDYRFTQAQGLETQWQQSERFYGLAMPQLYGDVAVNDLTVRAGHFYAPIGFESVMAPENFFYSHSYSQMYGSPYTFTGMMFKYDLNEWVNVNFGFSRGWDQWEDNNDKLSYFGGINWQSESKETSVGVEFTTGNEQTVGESRRNAVTMVFNQLLYKNLRYVFQADYGRESNVPAANQTADWYGVTNYFFYDLNPCWSLGFRYEIFGDRDGNRVAGMGYPHGIALPAAPGRWTETALGVNYKPNNNVIVRSELRWDYCEPLAPNLRRPFNDGRDNAQFLWGTDLIFKF